MKKKSRPKKYAKKLSLQPLQFDDAVSALLKVKPQKRKATKKK